MRKSKFSDKEISYVVQQMEAGIPANELARKYGVSEKTIYLWRKKYGGLAATEVKELRLLREENRKLKRLVADLALDKQMLQDVLSKKL